MNTVYTEITFSDSRRAVRGSERSDTDVEPVDLADSGELLSALTHISTCPAAAHTTIQKKGVSGDGQ
jgi:hypothetical protein